MFKLYRQIKDEIMNSRYIFSSEIIVDKTHENEAWEIWKDKSIQPVFEETDRICYRQEDSQNHFLELIAMNDFSESYTLLTGRTTFNNKLTPYMKSDWKQQLFKHVESPKPEKNKLPQAPKLQLRYIEVPLSVHDDYLNWRESTIFKTVRNAEQIDSFQAYHTLLSTQPGVMFFSGFSGDSKKYMKNIFETSHYKKIISDAGSKYISGGENGLFTRIFVKEH